MRYLSCIMRIMTSTEQTARDLLNGHVGVIPTDTVYGLAARVVDESAVKRLYSLKNREHKPGTIIAANVKQLINMGIFESSLHSVKPFWPGPVSVIVNLDDDFEFLHQGVCSVACRVVADTRVKQLLEQTGPLLTSSANYPGEPVANNIDEAFNYFGDSIDFYLDGGDLSNRTASTIIQVTDGNIKVLRQGSTKIQV